MSASLMGACFYLDLSRPEKLILLAMADHANDGGDAIYPGNARLALKTSSTERSVQRGLQLLESGGYITRVSYPAGGRGRAVEWAIDTSKVYEEARSRGWTKSKTTTPVTPFANRKGDTSDVKGDKNRAKGCHQCHPNHQEPSEPRSVAVENGEIGVEVTEVEVEERAEAIAREKGAEFPKGYAAKMLDDPATRDRIAGELEAEKRRALVKALVDECPDCDDNGMEWYDDGTPAGAGRKCPHPSLVGGSA